MLTIEPEQDAESRPVLPDQEKLTHGFVCMPEEYQAKITPRSFARAKLVRRVAEGGERVA